MSEFVDLLQRYGKLGCVEALARVLDDTNPWLSDQLIAELETIKELHPLDTATCDELKGIIYKEYGASRRIGQVEQKAILSMTAQKVSSVRRACSMQQKRQQKAIDVEVVKYEATEATVNDLAAPVEKFLARQTGMPGSGGGKEASTGLDRLNKTLEALMLHTSDNIKVLEACYHDKMEALKVLGEAIDEEGLSEELIDAMMERPLGKLNEEINMQNKKLSEIDIRIASKEDDLEKLERERPLEIAERDEIEAKLQERLQSATDHLDALTEQEAEINEKLTSLRDDLILTKQKQDFLCHSKRVKAIGKQEVRRRRRHTTRSKDELRDNSASKQVVHLPKIVLARGKGGGYRKSGNSRNPAVDRTVGMSSDGWETDEDAADLSDMNTSQGSGGQGRSK